MKIAIATPAALALVLALPARDAGDAGGAGDRPAADEARTRIDAVLDELAASGDFAAAEVALASGFDEVAATADLAERELFRESAFALRLVRQLAPLDEARRLDQLAYLRGHGELARALVFLVDPRHDAQPKVYALLDRLRRHAGERLGEFPNLAAAMCVVHDEPLERRINENKAGAPDAIRLFDYFTSNENRMLFGLRAVPAELLVYVVDATVSVDEMLWALGRYAGDPAVGGRFFDVEYDVEHFRTGTPKKATLAGWTLRAILAHGGVCADQAHFAMSVGKAIGVPTAYATGMSSEVAHAWVGFLEARGREARWNFDVGRYEEYRGIRGRVLDPQTRRHVADSSVSLLAELAAVPETDRHAAAAYVDAARRLVEAPGPVAAPAAGGAGRAPVQRGPDVESILAVLEQGLRISPGCVAGWHVLRDLAAAGRLDLEQKKRWAGVLNRLCGERYPDFYLEVLAPMIESIPDVREQDALWEKALVLFRGRHDLAASVLTRRGEMWEAAGEPERAGRCYEEIIARYANAGPFVLGALKRAEGILRDQGQERRVLALYERAFASIRMPRDLAGPFYVQSNFFRVGSLYAERLEQAGLAPRAAAVRAQIGLP